MFCAAATSAGTLLAALPQSASRRSFSSLAPALSSVFCAVAGTGLPAPAGARACSTSARCGAYASSNALRSRCTSSIAWITPASVGSAAFA